MENYLDIQRELTPEQIPADLQSEEGTKKLRVKLYYNKGARQRGLKLSIHRINQRGYFESVMIMSKYNCLLHVKDMARKNDKIGKAYAEAIEANFDAIADVALASMEPDWQAIYPLIGQPA